MTQHNTVVKQQHSELIKKKLGNKSKVPTTQHTNYLATFIVHRVVLVFYQHVKCVINMGCTHKHIECTNHCSNQKPNQSTLSGRYVHLYLGGVLDGMQSHRFAAFMIYYNHVVPSLATADQFRFA